MSEIPPFDLMRAKMDALTREMEADLNRQLFRDDGPRVAVSPTPWWRRRWWRVRGYLSTLWDALRGRHPYDWNDE